MKQIIKDLLEELKKHNPKKRIKLGFHEPHSYRGDYMELGVEPKENVTVENMIEILEGAIGVTFPGWKGDYFTMYDQSRVYLAIEGEAGSELSVLLLQYMLKDEIKD